jgi:hypothetical protein
VCDDSIPGLRVDELDISDLPLINTDLETGGGTGFPPAVEAFRAKVCQADCFLFGAPEYNYSIASTSFAPLPPSCLAPRSFQNSDLLPARTDWRGISMDKMLGVGGILGVKLLLQTLGRRFTYIVTFIVFIQQLGALLS